MSNYYDMKLLMLILCLCLLVRKLQAECNISDIDFSKTLALPKDSTKAIYDNEEKSIFASKYTGKIDSVTCTSIKPEYDGFFTANIHEGTLQFNFSGAVTDTHNFDKVTAKTSSTFALASFNCNFKCGDSPEHTLKIDVKVTDINENKPTFQETNYEFTIPVPFTKGYVLDIDPIIAEDIDFSNQGVDFTIDPDDFEITSQENTGNKKQYIASFKANKFLHFVDQKEYTLTVTDRGIYPRKLSSAVTLTLKADSNDSADNPAFEDTSYTFNYKSTNNKYELEPVDGKLVKLKTSKPDAINASFSGDLADYLKVGKYDQSLQTLPIEVGKKIDSTESSERTSILSVYTDGVYTAYTVIVVKLPEVKWKEGKSVYSVTYNADDKILTGDVTIPVEASYGTPKCSISGDKSDNFLVEYKASACVVKASSNISNTDLMGYSYLQIQISAKVDGIDKSAEGTLIVNLPNSNDKLEFKRNIYKATYSIDPLKVALNETIEFKSQVEGNEIKIEIDKDYSKYFKPEFSSDQVTITASIILPDDILQNQDELLLTLLATDKDKTGTCSLKLSLPPETKAPAFKEAYCKVSYPDDAKVGDELPLDTSFTNVANNSKLELAIDDYSDNFGVQQSSSGDKWVLKIKNVPSKLPVITTISANRKGSTSKSKIPLYIQGSTPPRFEKPYYKIKYTEDKTKHSISGDTTMLVRNVEDTSKLQINAEDGFKEYFSFQYDNHTDLWTIGLEQNLSNDILAKNKQLLIKLFAMEEGESSDGSTTLIVDLPDSKGQIPVFSKTLYEANYVYEGDKYVVEMTDDNSIIIIKNGDGAIVDLSCTEQDNIDQYLNIDLKNGTYIISVSQPLPTDTLQKTSLPITIKASVDGIDGLAGLVVNLPSKEKDIDFEDVLFHGEYDAKDNKLTVGEIRIKTDAADNKVEYKLEESNYAQYFNLSYKDKQLTVSLKDPIPKSKLKDVSVIVLKIIIDIKASISDKASAVLSLQVKGAESVPATDTDDSGANATVYIIVICLLALLLLILVAAALVFYNKKLRNRSFMSLDEEKPHVSFDEDAKDYSRERKESSVTTRRPTGFAFNPPPPEEGDGSDANETSTEPQKESDDANKNSEDSVSDNRGRKKSVVFDDNVEKLELGSGNDVEIRQRKDSSIASRRPTGFVFNPPPPEEDGGLDANETSTEPGNETDDYYKNTVDSFGENRSRKKSVVFDDNIEKLLIDSKNEDDNTEAE